MKFWTLLIAVFFVAGATSCKKCLKCTYVNEYFDTYEAESCASSKKREEFEESIRSQWEYYGAVTCTEE